MKTYTINEADRVFLMSCVNSIRGLEFLEYLQPNTQDEQAAFERWANDDVVWDTNSKAKNGASYKHLPTNCAWTGWVARSQAKGSVTP